MTRIGSGGRPPTETPEAAKPAATDKSGEARATDLAQKAQDAKEAKVVDSFQRVAPQLTQQLTAMAGKKAVPGLIFTNEHLYQVALAFAGLLRKNPNADRRTRARMFAKAILSSKRFGKVFDQADEAELEKAYDLIGDQLDGSPVLAQLVDEVTEGARKMNLG
ncbi:MAG: hypothetical protein HY903_08835 [Deltaproteobacteria bacterium]|nr:hypothetical protein [Deltaproteobacteria bacterium]